MIGNLYLRFCRKLLIVHFELFVFIIFLDKNFAKRWKEHLSFLGFDDNNRTSYLRKYEYEECKRLYYFSHFAHFEKKAKTILLISKFPFQLIFIK